MSFFFHTGLGEIYFIVLATICAMAIWRGSKDYRLLSYCILGVFLADRILLSTINNEANMMALGGLAEFIAFAIVLLFTRSKVGLFISFFFAVKILMYISLVANFISFDTMAAWSELAGYGQLLVLAGGTINDNRGRLGHNFLSGMPIYNRRVSTLKSRMAAKRPSRIHTGSD